MKSRHDDLDLSTGAPPDNPEGQATLNAHGPPTRGPKFIRQPTTRPFSLSLADLIACAYIGIIFGSGPITNLINTGSVNTGTTLMFLVGALLSGIGVIVFLRSRNRQIVLTGVVILGLSSFLVWTALIDSNPLNQRLSELFIYLVSVWPIFYFMQVRHKGKQQLYVSIVMSGFAFLSSFAIVQSLFGAVLPRSVYVLRGGRAFNVFTAHGHILRPTGLVGNPIVLSSVLVLASALSASLWLQTRGLKYAFILILSVAANYLTYTRASFVLLFPVLLVVWLLHKKPNVIVFAIVSILLMATAASLLRVVKSSSNAMVARIEGRGLATKKSTIEHYAQIHNAIRAISAHPILGTGLGSESESKSNIITDGAWWLMLLELGTPLTIAVAIGIAVVLIPLVQQVLRSNGRRPAVPIAVIAFHAYVIPAAFIDSGILGHVPFELYWVAVGLAIAATTSNDASMPRRRRSRSLVKEV